MKKIPSLSLGGGKNPLGGVVSERASEVKICQLKYAEPSTVATRCK